MTSRDLFQFTGRPWNVPLLLSLQPLYGAIAAGCPAVVKPSELVPNFSSLLGEIFNKYLDPSAYRLVNGGIPETTQLLEFRWAHSKCGFSQKRGILPLKSILHRER